MFNKIFQLFKRKYTITLLNSKWEVIKTNLKLQSVPRQDEYIWLDDNYFRVINIVQSSTFIYAIVEMVGDKIN